VTSLKDRLDAWDRRVIQWSVRLRRPWLTPLFVALTYSGSGAVWFPLAILFIVLLRLDSTAIPGLLLLLATMTGALLSLLLGEGLKKVIRRPRPWEALPDHTTAVRRPRDKSMPSTHSSTAMALCVGLWVHGHPLAPFITPWSLLVVSSRFYLGVHYPTDLLAGTLLGALFGLIDWSFLVRAVVLGW